jgi:hypothetical protein
VNACSSRHQSRGGTGEILVDEPRGT